MILYVVIVKFFIFIIPAGIYSLGYPHGTLFAVDIIAPTTFRSAQV